MSEANANAPRERVVAILGGALLLAALLAAYANHFHNSFHFDDAHTIENNAALQSLRNIPLFFVDATTFSSLPSNQSYRPLVSTLLAIDYSLGHGLQPFWFHLSIFALFILLVLMLVLVIDRLLKNVAPSPSNSWIALGAAALYGLHPANADTVNYIIASSEIMATLGVMASFAVYFGFPGLRRYYIYVLPAAIAILAKPTAAIFAPLFAVFRLLFPDEKIKRRGFACFLEIIASFLICGTMLLLVQRMTPQSWVAGAANARNYLITQPYVALLYFKTFFWPSGLSADYDLNPLTTINDPRFWTGFAFIIFFSAAAIAAAAFKKTRLIGFGLLWFLITLLPTSLFPLAEVMNDHRTFLSYIGLVIAIAGGAGLLTIKTRDPHATLSLRERRTAQPPGEGGALLVVGGATNNHGNLDRQPSWKTIAVMSAVVLFLCASGYATFQRNKIWKGEETLWHDVVIKSPRNGRGLMNYGNTLMAKGDYEGALDYFHRAQQLTPQYFVLLINLAIAEDATKQSAAAEQHFKEALRLAPSSPDSYTYYARYLLAHARADEARAFLQSALELSPTDLTARELLAQTNGQAITEPTKQTPESYLALSLQLYREERYVESIVACQLALALRPSYAEAWNNIGAAYNKLGRFDKAAAACEQALRYKPGFELARNNLQYAHEMASQH